LPPRVDGPVDYDTYAQSDRRTQIGLFNAITPENCAEIVRTQAQRWLALNRPSLTAKQIEAAESVVSMITPDLYRSGLTEAQRAANIEPALKRLEELFTREQVWRFVGAGAPYIPVRDL
jgi:hypothetical protein